MTATFEGGSLNGRSYTFTDGFLPAGIILEGGEAYKLYWRQDAMQEAHYRVVSRPA